MNNPIEKIIKLVRNDEYDFINIVSIDYEIDQKGFDLDGIISNTKNTSEINLIAVKDHNVANITFSKSKLYQIESIVDYISKNSYLNKKLSVYYLSAYLKDSANKKNFNILNDYKEIMKNNKVISHEKIEEIYGYKFISFITSNIKTKIKNINSYKVKRVMSYSETYTDCLLKINNDIFINLNNKPNSTNIEERLIFYKNKFTKIPKLRGIVKISGYAIACLLRQLMNVFNSDAISSNTTFIKTNSYGKKLFASYIDIIDCPNCKQFYENIPFDHNGIKTRKKYIVKRGIVFDLFGEINSCLRNGLASPGNYYKKSSDVMNGLITYRNIILNVKKVSNQENYNYEIKEFSLDSFLNIQTGLFSGNCYGFKIGEEAEKPILCSINIDILKFFNEIQSISENKIYDDVLCPDIIFDFKTSY